MKKTKFQRAILEAHQSLAVKLDAVRPGRDNPRYGAVTLGEYRFSFPGSTSMPTITQRGLVAMVLERHHRKQQRLMRRRAIRARVLEIAAGVVSWLRSAFTPVAAETIGERVAVPVRDIAPGRF
jgi:hypothetical protein